jgi:hypothetical protein
MKAKKPNRILAIFGMMLILFSGGFYFYGTQYYAMQDIQQVVEDSVGESSKSKGFEVTVKYGFKGYKVYLTLRNGSDWFEYPSWCGCIGTDFLTSFKEEHADIDAQISEYSFDFVESTTHSYSSGYYPTTYTAQYSNDQKESSIYQIEIALNDGKTEYEPETYLEYLNEWSTRKYYSYERIQLTGEHYRVAINDDDSYTIEPNTEADLERNPDSTLMWYLDEYASQYFTLSNVQTEFTSDRAGNGIEINFRFTNNFNSFSQFARIVFYVYNEDGEVIGTTGGFTSTLEANESGNYVVSEIYADETPAYCRVVYIEYFKESSYTGDVDDAKFIVFE